MILHELCLYMLLCKLHCVSNSIKKVSILCCLNVNSVNWTFKCWTLEAFVTNKSLRAISRGFLLHCLCVCCIKPVGSAGSLLGEARQESQMGDMESTLALVCKCLPPVFFVHDT